MKMKKFLAIILSLICIFSLVACKKNKKPSGAGDGGASADGTHYVEGTLHKVSVTDSNRPFIVNGQTEYKIVADDDMRAQKAARFMKSQLLAATGVSLDIVTQSSVSWSSEAKYIVLGCKDLFEAASLTMPQDDLGSSGYYIKNAGSSVFIEVGGTYGYQQGMLSFLKHVIGYEMFSLDLVIYEKDGATLPDMEIIERPDIEWIPRPENGEPDDEIYGMGMNPSDEFVANAGGTHNSFNYFPVEKYGKTHSDWFAASQQQLCFTAHGNEDELKEMVKILADTLADRLLENPNTMLLNFSIRDNPYKCECSACTESIAKYGAISASLIQFLNAVADEIEIILTDYAEQNDEPARDFTIFSLAYYAYEAAPVIKNSQGEWVPVDDSVKPGKHVAIQYAPIKADYTVSVYDETNSVYLERMQQWSAISDKMLYWFYTMYAHSYAIPYNSFDTLVEWTRVAKENGAVHLLFQGQITQGNGRTGFQEFKNYLVSKILFDVNLDFSYIVDRYFTYYFGPAKEIMLEYFNDMRSWQKHLRAEYNSVGLFGDILSGRMIEETYWPKRLLEDWNGRINDGVKAIEYLRDDDSALYSALYDHLVLESIFPRYVILQLYGSKMSADELTAMRLRFRDDCVRLGYSSESENGSMDVLYSTWFN